MNQTDIEQALVRYIDHFAQLDEATLCDLATLFTPDARFRDPFNDVSGRDAIVVIFRHMFASLRQPRFRIEDWALRDRIAYIHWQFDARLDDGRAIGLSGMSRVVFTSDGLVREHLDYWDAAEQVYMQIPLLGSVLRLIQRKFRA